MAAPPATPLLKLWEVFKGFGRIVFRDGQETDILEIGCLNRQIPVVYPLNWKIHVTLSPRNPHISNKYVAQRDGFSVTLDDHGSWLVTRGHGRKRDLP